MEFIFDDGYKITTFFNWFVENQWALFLSDQSTISVDCSSYEEIEKTQNIAKHFTIVESYEKLDIPGLNGVVNKIDSNEEQLSIDFGNEITITLLNCAWRLEQDGRYLLGSADVCFDQNKIELLSPLIGKRLQDLAIAGDFMDARFQFENQFVLNTFTRSHRTPQWTILSKFTPLFSSNSIINHPGLQRG